MMQSLKTTGKEARKFCHEFEKLFPGTGLWMVWVDSDLHTFGSLANLWVHPVTSLSKSAEVQMGNSPVAALSSLPSSASWVLHSWVGSFITFPSSFSLPELPLYSIHNWKLCIHLSLKVLVQSSQQLFHWDFCVPGQPQQKCTSVQDCGSQELQCVSVMVSFYHFLASFGSLSRHAGCHSSGLLHLVSNSLMHGLISLAGVKKQI